MKNEHKLRLYFAHNFNNRKEFRKIELALEKELGIELLNPFYDDDTRVEEMHEIDTQTYRFENKFNRDQESAELIVRRDLKNLASCDGLLTIVEKPSFGTTIEICNAVLMRKKIFFISKDYIKHPWIKIYTDYRFETVDEFKRFIKEQKHAIH